VKSAAERKSEGWGDCSVQNSKKEIVGARGEETKEEMQANKSLTDRLPVDACLGFCFWSCGALPLSFLLAFSCALPPPPTSLSMDIKAHFTPISLKVVNKVLWAGCTTHSMGQRRMDGFSTWSPRPGRRDERGKDEPAKPPFLGNEDEGCLAVRLGFTCKGVGNQSYLVLSCLVSLECILWEGFFWRMPKQAYTVPCRASHPHGKGTHIVWVPLPMGRVLSRASRTV